MPGPWQTIPTKVANIEVLRDQLTGLTADTEYEVEYDSTPDFSSSLVTRGSFRTRLADLRNKLGAVRVSGNALVGWDASADLEFDTSVSFPTPSFAHPVTVEADTADPGATLVIDNASQTGEDKDVLTFRITVTFGSLPVRVYTCLLYTSDAADE